MNDEMKQLFDEREQLRAENARLRDALAARAALATLK